MPNTLFPDEVLDPPVTRPADPVFWVRRLVLVEDRLPTGRVIRDIEFRRGLNVIRVIDRPKDHRGSVGHSVGKTLLTRLIRYCLGERYYATEAVAELIVEHFPSGYAIAEVTIGDTAWVVARPFETGGRTESVAGQSTDWHDALHPDVIRDSFEQFTESLSSAVIGLRPSLYLPDAKRNAMWLDLLGWLSRDQDCNFSHYNVWRSKDARSGSRDHTRNDASLIAAWGLLLVNAKEAEQREGHQQLLTQKEEAERVQRVEVATQSASRRVLNERFPDLSQEEDDSLFATTAGTQANDKVTQLKNLLGDLEHPQNLDEMKKAIIDLRRKQGDAAGKVERVKGAILARESQIQTEESANARSVYELKCFCPDKPAACIANRSKPATGDTERSERIQQLKGEVAKLGRERDNAQTELDAASEALEKAETAFDTAEAKHRDSLSNLGKQIGRWEAHAEEVTAYSKSRARMLDAQRKLEKLESAIERSEKALRKTREVQQQHLTRMSAAYTAVLSDLLGQETAGELVLDGWGVHPQPASGLRANGLAMATLATVIGFDLMALRAAVEGLCPMPRFLIHDSPKASDLESALYDRVYEPLLMLEGMSAEPAFQYIITTTTPPANTAAGEPYVRLTLDACTPEGRLLKFEF